MEAETLQDPQVLAAQHAQAREKLEVLVRDLHAIDDELDGLAVERRQYRLLQDVCGSLEELRGIGGAELFWGDGTAADASGEHLRRARSRLDDFQKRLEEVEDRRRALLEEIKRQEDHTYLLEDDVFEAQEEEERRKLEWIVEREIGSAAHRELIMPWARGDEDDRRFRKSLAMSLAISLLFALIIPLVDLPLPPPLEEPVEVPERVVRMLIEPPPPAPPVPLDVTRPPPPEQLARPKPVEKPAAVRPVEPEKQVPVERMAENLPKGILAFREKLAGLKEPEAVARLGKQARINSAEPGTATRNERSMLTSNAPGTSGGINLASLSRSAGQGGGGGGTMQGVATTRASSSISSGGSSDRPLAGAGAASRTDEEIQIVFDRYKAALYRLYNRELRKDPSLRGQMVLRLTIEPDGSVSMCALQASDMNAPELSAQVVDRVRGINFGAKDVEAITILYPIDFLPAA